MVKIEAITGSGERWSWTVKGDGRDDPVSFVAGELAEAANCGETVAIWSHDGGHDVVVYLNPHVWAAWTVKDA